MEEIKSYTLESTPKETLQKWYYLMTLGRKLDERAPNYLKQALGWSYHAPYAGHDGIQLAIGQVFNHETDQFTMHLSVQIIDLAIAIDDGVSQCGVHIDESLQ